MNRGILSALGAYLSWGILPVYFKALSTVSSIEIVAHRIVWSFLFLTLVLSVRKEWKPLKTAAFNLRVLAVYALTACLLGANWMIYVWAVNSGHAVESSLGYFINPLLSVALGVILLREKLRPIQWAAVGIAASGVIYLSLEYGSLPWIALGLAGTFALYGLLKKIAPLGSLHGLSIETAVLLLPAVGYLLFLSNQGTGALGHSTLPVTVLLLLAGVMTSVPLLMYASAARAIPLTLIGILQYIAPTAQFLIAVFLFREPFGGAQVIGYGVIWFALLVFTLEGLANFRKSHPLPA